MNDITIPTYIVNTSKQIESLNDIKQQFQGKIEFDIHITHSHPHTNSHMALWTSICEIIAISEEKNEDVIIICKDNHQFTEDYNKTKLIAAIYEAHRLNATLLFGGIAGGFNHILPLASGISWLDACWESSFIVIFRSFFRSILDENFHETDVVENKLSEMTSNKFVMYPMISTIKDISDVDVHGKYNPACHSMDDLEEYGMRMKKIHQIFYLHTARLK
ncbi:hypothetical protein ABE426_05710 [Sphingobacterium faecium]|uniref:hypothetical protein n=1 Tax=Sphingobacterium faecium TaxID=34087 RepID=UPI00320B4DF9